MQRRFVFILLQGIPLIVTHREACRGVEVAGRTFDRKVEGSSPDINIIGCRQEGHPDIKWLTAPAKVLLCRHRPTPNTGENGRKL